MTDLNNHLEKIVEGIITEITANVLTRIDAVISNAVANRLLNYDFSSPIKEIATDILDKKVSEYNIDSRRLENKITEKINLTIDEVQANTAAKIAESVSKSIASTNFDTAMSSAISGLISSRIKDINFPEQSIPAKSINFEDFQLSGNAVKGGIITEFSSTGIDDRTTQVAITLLDNATVIENNLLTQDLTVEGSMTINGNFIVNGDVPEDSAFFNRLVTRTSENTVNRLDNTLFDGYSKLIFNRIKDQGIDLNRITINGNEVIKDNQLGPGVIESNLQKLGLLKELQVIGESLLAETLYVTSKRVGINTIEPSSALTIWDDEVEIVALKKQKDTGVIGTPRQQRLILSSNSNENIVLNTDGSVQINELRMGRLRFTCADQPPNYVSEKGHVVWNTNPNLGGPLGWVCLGAANWANFGIID